MKKYKEFINESNSEIIDVSEIMKKHDNYISFIEEMRSLLTGQRIDVYYKKGIKYDFYRSYDVKELLSIPLRDISDFNKDKSLFVIKPDYEAVYPGDKIVIKHNKQRFTEEDPYGEEDWGDEDRIEIDKLINENKLNESAFPPITITNKLEEYINKYKWSITMLDFIGNTYVPIDIDRAYVIYAKDSTWYIPFDCVEGNKKYKKIEKPDLDPYGEEDWGYEEIK